MVDHPQSSILGISQTCSTVPWNLSQNTLRYITSADGFFTLESPIQHTCDTFAHPTHSKYLKQLLRVKPPLHSTLKTSQPYAASRICRLNTHNGLLSPNVHILPAPIL